MPFTQEDPIGLAGGMNAYGFAGGDRINFSDPMGLCPVEKDGIPCGLKGAAIGAAIGTGLGAVASIGCAVVTAGICAAGSPAIVSGLAAGGGIVGGLIGTYNAMSASDDEPIGTVRNPDGSPKDRGQQRDEIERAQSRNRSGINRIEKSKQRGRQEDLEEAQRALEENRRKKPPTH